MSIAYLSIGSNLDKENNVRTCISHIRDDEDIKSVIISPAYENRAVGPKGQPLFLNLAMKIETALPAEILFQRTRRWEQLLGRERTQNKFAPRTIDIDLILYDDLVLNHDDFILPHPQLDTQAFVLYPLVQLAPDLKHPARSIFLRDRLRALPFNESEFKPVKL